MRAVIFYPRALVLGAVYFLSSPSRASSCYLKKSCLFLTETKANTVNTCLLIINGCHGLRVANHKRTTPMFAFEMPTSNLKLHASHAPFLERIREL